MATFFNFLDAGGGGSPYRIDDAQIAEVRVKGASDAVAREANANIRVLADRLQRGEIDAAEFYASMQREVKFLHMGQAALARGGVDSMTPANWARVENIVAAQFSGVDGKFPGLRSFAEDIAGGRYGNAGELSSGVLNRAGMYADAGRATYENERMALAGENGHGEAMRVRGASDSCVDCVSWAGKWKPIEEIEPIASSVCGARCFCAIITRIGKENAPSIESVSQEPGGRLPKEIPAIVRDRLAPLATHAFRASGTPISSAMELAPELKDWNQVLDDLDRVLGDGQLSKIFVDRLYGDLSKSGLVTVGEYFGGIEASMALHPQAARPGMTLFHEVGHWLDERIIGNNSYEPKGVIGSFTDAKSLKQALDNSVAIRQLRVYKGKKTVPFKDASGKTQFFYSVKGNFVDYLLQPEEMFARSFSQYVVTRNGGESLRSELASYLDFDFKNSMGGLYDGKRGRPASTLYYSVQWRDHDFRPIAQEFDKLFIKKGWIK